MAEEEETTSKENEEKKEEETKKEESHTLSQEEINKLIEAARTQEKDKLYTTINSLKDQVSELSKDRKADKDAKDKAEKEAQEKAETERQAKLTAEERFSEKLKRLEEKQLQDERKREDLEKQLDREKKERELLEYRQNVIEAEKEPFLKELVRGDSKDEIDKSLTTAKSRYQEYFQAAVSSAEGNKGGEKPQMPKPGGGDTEETLDNVGGLIPQIDPDDVSHTRVSEDYLKNREELLKRVAGAYKRTSSGH